MQKNILDFLAISIIIIAIGVNGIFFIMELMADEYPEKVYKEMTSPDGSTKAIITHYKRYVPYGVMGYIYLEKDGERRRVRSFFLDFIQDIEQEKHSTVYWSENDNALYFGSERLEWAN